MELRVNSPAGGDPAVYQWPLVAAVNVTYGHLLSIYLLPVKGNN